MQYGHFDDALREYVIDTPTTPLPWINYLGSEDFFALVSNTAGGYCFYKDARLRRITRYRYNGALWMPTASMYMSAWRTERSGTPAGSLPSRRWTFTAAATAWAIPSSGAKGRHFLRAGHAGAKR